MHFISLIMPLFLLASRQTDYSDMSLKIDQAMLKFMAEKKISGAVTLAVHRDEVIHFSPVGLADIEKTQQMTKESLFRIASLTKNFTAVSVMTLQDEGKVNINDKVEKYLPEFKHIKLKKDDGKGPVDLRIWHLMSHMSGIDMPKEFGLDNMPSLEVASKEAAKLNLNFRPGSQWQYSRGLDVCGRIIEVVSGMKFEDFLKVKITGPLALNDTAFTLNAEQVERLVTTYEPGTGNTIIPASKEFLTNPPAADTRPMPSGGLISSTEDIATFYAMLLNKGVYNGRRIVSEESIRLLTTSRTGNKKVGFVPGSAWGLGFGLVSNPQGVTSMLNPGTFGHGGAFGTQAWVDPVTETIYVLMIQRTKFGNSDASDIRAKFQKTVAKYIKRDWR